MIIRNKFMLTKIIRKLLLFVPSCIVFLYNILKKCYRVIYNLYEMQLFECCGNRLCIKPPANIYGAEYMMIGNGFMASPGLRLECLGRYRGQKFSPKLIIGNNVGFGNRCHVGCINEISIGDNVTLGSNILIEDHSHGTADDIDLPVLDRHLYSKGPIVIENNVWIGDNVSILGNVTIGECSIVGANAVVTHDIPPYSIAVGVPAKVIKTLK